MSISQLSEGVENPKSLSKLRRSIQDKDEKIRLRIEKEMIVRLKRGSDLGRFDQFLGR